jgi:hypothetical protein
VDAPADEFQALAQVGEAEVVLVRLLWIEPAAVVADFDVNLFALGPDAQVATLTPACLTTLNSSSRTVWNTVARVSGDGGSAGSCTSSSTSR